MKCNKALLLVALLGAFSLSSCSHFGTAVCTINCGGGGTATLSMTMSATPLAPPAKTSILSFSVTITGIALSPTTGSDINIPLTATTYVLDMTKLQSDSAFMGQVLASVPVGTYNKVTLAVSSVAVTFCTQLVPGTAGCANGSIATVSSLFSTPSSPISLTLIANQKTGLQFQLNMATALTINSLTQVVSGVSLTAPNVLSAVALPPVKSSLAAGQLDFVEDFTGVVFAITGSTVTIQTTEHGVITATNTPSTSFSPNCLAFGTGETFAQCVVVGQLASIDAALKADGTFALLEYDPLETTASEWIEGTVTAVPTSLTQFQIVTNDLFLKSTGSLIGTNLLVGESVTVKLGAGATFGVDSKGQVVPVEAAIFSSSNDTSKLIPGQTVAVRISSFAAKVGATPAIATVNFVGLRFTRVTGSVSLVAAPSTFSIQNLPPYFGATTQLLVQLNQTVVPTAAPTNFDGVTDASGLTVGQTVSIRALYFGLVSAQPFSAAKARIH